VGRVSRGCKIMAQEKKGGRRECNQYREDKSRDCISGK